MAMTERVMEKMAVGGGIVVRKPWMRGLLSFLMVFGPALIVMEADNGAGAVFTYMQAGGQYGLHLLWVLLLPLPICYFVQEMVVRLGIATGRGHAAMIYERFGKWWGRFSLFDLLAVNFLTLITDWVCRHMYRQLLLNDRALLGERWVNRPWNNWINWSIVVLLFGPLYCWRCR
jgi:Mn2+/Fe2+ NRAMP family transporter